MSDDNTSETADENDTSETALSYDEDDAPLSELTDNLESAETEQEVDETLPVVDSEPTQQRQTDPGSVSDSETHDGPLGDLAADVEKRRANSSEFEDLFDRESVSDIDSDRLWSQLESGDDFDPVTEDSREIREISKAKYCRQCEYFAQPPMVGCTNEGTDILEMPTLETFRVADCPMVLEDEELEGR